MDINFNIVEIEQYITFSNNIIENINYSLDEINGLFIETQEAFEFVKNKLSEINSLTLEFFNYAENLKNITSNKIKNIPKEKEYLDYPPQPIINGNGSTANEVKKIYENTCLEIDKQNEKIKRENENNINLKEKLQELDNCLIKILQELDNLKMRLFQIDSHLKANESNLLSNKNESERNFNNTQNLANKTDFAVNKTYLYALQLVGNNGTDNIYGNLHGTFKIKDKNELNHSFFQSHNNLVLDEKIKKQKKENKIVIIKSRDVDEFFEILSKSNLEKGDVVKIPSYNLFNLGNQTLFESMKNLGFKNIEKDGSVILEDGTIAWVKYE